MGVWKINTYANLLFGPFTFMLSLTIIPAISPYGVNSLPTLRYK